jgi:hypothetical protein
MLLERISLAEAASWEGGTGGEMKILSGEL